MALTRVDTGLQSFPDFNRNQQLANAQIYIGVPGLDPDVLANQYQAYVVQEDGTQVAVPQPIRTSAGGVPTYLGSPAQIGINEASYSFKVLNAFGSQIYYIPDSSQMANYATNASAVVFEPSGVGSVITTVQAKLRETVSRADYDSDVNFDSARNALTGRVDHRIRTEGGTTDRLLSAKLGEVVSIKDAGALGNGVADDLAAFSAIRTAVGSTGTIHLVGPATYFFAGSRPDLSGVNIWADPDVTIKVDENPNTKDMKLLTPVTIENTVHLTTLIKPANTKIQLPELFNVAPGLVEMALDEVSSVVDLTTWLHKVYVSATGDISTTNGSATVTSSGATWAVSFTSNSQVFYPAANEAGTLFEINAASLTAPTANAAGIFAKSATGVWTVRVLTGSGNLLVRKTDNTGVITVTADFALPNGGAYGWLVPEQTNLGFVVDSSDVVTVVINGLPVYKIDDIATNAGFVVSQSTSSNQVVLNDLLKTTNYHARLKKPLNIGVIGDSISYGAWCSNDIVDLLPSFVQNLPQVGDVDVSNYAVSGTASDYWATGAGASVDLSAHDFVLCMIGTNDLQGSVPVATYVSNLVTIAANIIADGAVPIFGIFPIFTTASVSGVTGVTTTNYAAHAKYTHALKKFCIQNDYTFADMRRNFGANLAWYGDNIHPTVEGQISIMAAWAEAIMKRIEGETGWLLS